MNTVIKRAWNKNKLVNVEDLTGMTFQAESGGHTFEISGVDDTGAAVSLSGTVEGRFLRADNAEIIISGTASSGKASVTLSEACYAIPGRFLLTVYVTSGGQKVAVYAATGSVVATSGTASGSIPPLVTDSIQTAGDASIGGDLSVLGSVAVGGAVDILQRRAKARLSSAGWYRILIINAANQNISSGSSGFVLRFNIIRNYSNTPNETHSVELYGTYLAMSFKNETSKSLNLGITKIRYKRLGNQGYVDIYYALDNANDVSVFFDVFCLPDYFGQFTSLNFEAVDAGGEGTVLASYDFVGNTGWETGNATADNAIQLPSTWKELYFDARFGGNTLFGFSGSIMHENMSLSTERFLLSHYEGASSYHDVIVEVSGTYVKLYRWKYNGNDYLSSSTLKVKYRSMGAQS